MARLHIKFVLFDIEMHFLDIVDKKRLTYGLVSNFERLIYQKDVGIIVGVTGFDL